MEYEDSFDCEILIEYARTFWECHRNINEGKYLNYSHYMLATSYRFGWGTNIDYNLTLEYYNLAVKHGSSKAARQLCMIYLCVNNRDYINILKPDYLKALEYARLGADFPITDENSECDIHLCRDIKRIAEQYVEKYLNGKQ